VVPMNLQVLRHLRYLFATQALRESLFPWGRLRQCHRLTVLEHVRLLGTESSLGRLLSRPQVSSDLMS
jgi:hypothetical protein